LTLVRNPHYWDHGLPYLDSLVFQSEGSDQSAFDTLESGQGQLMSPSTISLVQTIKQAGQYQVVYGPPIAWEFVSLNQQAPPFNNLTAREAVIYATNPKILEDELYDGYFPLTEGPSASGQLFYQWKVPGYPAYNLAKAKQLVQQLGGLTVTLLTTSNTVFWQTEAEALDQQWAQAGITTNIDLTTLPALEVFLKNGNWQAVDSNWGNYADPALAIPNYFASTGPFTGSHDAVIDSLLAKGAASTNPAGRQKDYYSLYAHMAQTATADFLYQKKTFFVATKQVQGIPTTEPYIYWEYVWMK
jgi:peptide/nickel transport system substrate-binding protein